MHSVAEMESFSSFICALRAQVKGGAINVLSPAPCFLAVAVSHHLPQHTGGKNAFIDSHLLVSLYIYTHKKKKQTFNFFLHPENSSLIYSLRYIKNDKTGTPDFPTNYLALGFNEK